MTTGSAAKYSIPPAPSNLYNGEADIEDEDHYYRYRIEKSKDNLTNNKSRWLQVIFLFGTEHCEKQLNHSNVESLVIT